MFRIVFVILISVSFIFANNIQESMAKDNFYGQSEQKFHGPNFKFEGNRTKVYNDSIVVDFKIYCGNWIERKFFSGEPDFVKKCWLMAKDGKSSIDSVVHKNGFYELYENIYDTAGFRVYDSRIESGLENSYKYGSCDIYRYEKGKLVSFEMYDSLGKLISLESFVWDEQGRLKERTLWNTYDPYGLNGTYNFIYGSPCDSVRVSPIDYYLQGWDSRSEKGKFNGSFGKIPEKGDSEYEAFAENPYDFEASPKLLERQKKRCEDYRKSLKK